MFRDKPTISDIVMLFLKEEGRDRVLSDDVVFLQRVYHECVRRGIMKGGSKNGVGNVISGIVRAERFDVFYFRGKSLFVMKGVQL